MPIHNSTRCLTRGAPIEASNRDDWITRDGAITDANHAVAGDIGEARASNGQTHARGIETCISAMQPDDAKVPGERTVRYPERHLLRDVAGDVKLRNVTIALVATGVVAALVAVTVVLGDSKAAITSRSRIGEGIRFIR